MNEDIVEQLKTAYKYEYAGQDMYREAIDEIERLREVGDKLAMHLDAFFGMLEPASNEIAEVLKEWKEARRG